MLVSGLNATDPLKEYLSRRDRWRTELESLQQRFLRIGNWRLATGGLALLLGWLAFGRPVISGWWLLVPLVVFIALVVWHQRVMRRRVLAERALRYYESGLGRIEDRWVGTGNSGDQFRDGSHVYAEDLDVFGKGSLFELIASAHTAAGEQTLAKWLLSPADRDQALSRQEAVRELCAQLNLREDIALLADDIRSKTNAETLEKWGPAPEVAAAPVLRPLALALMIAGLATLGAFLTGLLRLWPFLAILCCDFVFMAAIRKRVRRICDAVEMPAHDLRVLSSLLDRLERESFESSRLQELRADLEVRGLPASKRILRLERWIEWLDSGDHLLVRVIRPVLLWNEQVAMAIEAWRRESGPYIGRWLRAVGEFEALSSLASLAFEHPQWTFPTLQEGSEACLEAEALQHPLMSVAKCVPNNVSLDGNLQLLIVSGSNMSGKSTLLRAVGLNAVLAWAGAPVAAKHMQISALCVGASIRVVDSLQDNRSRFFAEITRIRQIADLTKSNALVLFLLDELLSGTNSHDRLIGASGIVRAFVRSGAIGLITTHDLALANIEQDLGPGAANVHFDDRIEDGRIEFDYVLRPGVVARSNALGLMRAIGLDV